MSDDKNEGYFYFDSKNFELTHEQCLEVKKLREDYSWRETAQRFTRNNREFSERHRLGEAKARYFSMVPRGRDFLRDPDETPWEFWNQNIGRDLCLYASRKLGVEIEWAPGYEGPGKK